MCTTRHMQPGRKTAKKGLEINRQTLCLAIKMNRFAPLSAVAFQQTKAAFSPSLSEVYVSPKPSVVSPHSQLCHVLVDPKCATCIRPQPRWLKNIVQASPLWVKLHGCGYCTLWGHCKSKTFPFRLLFLLVCFCFALNEVCRNFHQISVCATHIWDQNTGKPLNVGFLSTLLIGPYLTPTNWQKN